MIGLVAALMAQGIEVPQAAVFDLNCAEAAAWVLSWSGDDNKSGKTDDTTWKALNMESFYIGRLSGRDPSRNWLKIVVADMFVNGRNSRSYSDGLKDCRSVMDAWMTGKAP